MLAFLQAPPVVAQGAPASASLPGPQEATSIALQRVAPEVAANIPGFLDVRDSLEGTNRRTYIFNAGFDRSVLLPAVRGYEFIAPGFVRAGIHNIFRTLDQATTFVNYVLQVKPKRAGQTLGRLGINLTVGVVGLWDPATRLGVPEHQQNFGQTLARWGAGTGPYFVVPLLGPSSGRGFAGTVVDRLPYISPRLPSPAHPRRSRGHPRSHALPLRRGRNALRVRSGTVPLEGTREVPDPSMTCKGEGPRSSMEGRLEHASRVGHKTQGEGHDGRYPFCTGQD